MTLNRDVITDMGAKTIVAGIERMLAETAHLDLPQIIRDFGQVDAVKYRNAGNKFGLNEYTKGLVYAQLSNQKVWKDLVPKLPAIDRLFCHWEYDQVVGLAETPEKLVGAIKTLRAGNRSINGQIEALAGNLKKLPKMVEEIESTYTCNKTPQEREAFISEWRTRISSRSKKHAPYKLRHIGYPLASEMLKNVGLVSMKPDTHLLRICGTGRLGIFTAITDETGVTSAQMAGAQEEFAAFARAVDPAPWYVVYLDNIFWLFGAEKYGEICTKTPRCDICFLRKTCNYPGH